MQARDISTTNVITEGLRRSRRLEILVSNVGLPLNPASLTDRPRPRDRLHLVIDGVNGRTHYVETADASKLDEMGRGHIVSLDAVPIRIVAEANGGIYRPGLRLEATRDIIGQRHGDPDAFIRSHVRRLEALRRAGHDERSSPTIGESLTTSPSGAWPAMPPADSRISAFAFSRRWILTAKSVAQCGRAEGHNCRDW